MESIPAGDHRALMQRALNLAKKSPPRPTNFCVGAVLVNLDDGQIASEGYTLECQGNTHAEECCFIKLAEQNSTTEDKLMDIMTTPHALYTTMEPCFMRLSGKMPCVERVLRQKSWIRKVYVGVSEPETFVAKNPGKKMLEEGGIEVHKVPGLEDEILHTAKAGQADSD